MTKHRTAKGKEFNMQSFSDTRGQTIAVGNSGRNARGDLLGPGGVVIATSQEITNKVYDGKNKVNSAQVKLNPLDQEVSRKELIGADGIARYEITYADGSVEIVIKENQTDTVEQSVEPDVPINFIDDNQVVFLKKTKL